MGVGEQATVAVAAEVAAVSSSEEGYCWFQGAIPYWSELAVQAVFRLQQTAEAKTVATAHSVLLVRREAVVAEVEMVLTLLEQVDLAAAAGGSIKPGVQVRLGKDFAAETEETGPQQAAAVVPSNKASLGYPGLLAAGVRG